MAIGGVRSERVLRRGNKSSPSVCCLIVLSTGPSRHETGTCSPIRSHRSATIAGARFRSFPFVRSRRLDIEADLDGAGFEAPSFD